jgi:hypothetical protein
MGINKCIIVRPQIQCWNPSPPPKNIHDKFGPSQDFDCDATFGTNDKKIL